MKKHFTCANTALSTPPCNSHRVGTISLLILALMLGFSANAMAAENYDLYLRGDMNNWNATDAYKFTKTGNIFTLTVELTANTEQSWKIAASEWNNSTYGKENDSAGNPSLNGTAFTMTHSTSSANIKNTFNGTYTFTLDTSNDGSKLTISPVTPDPCPNCKTITKQ